MSEQMLNARQAAEKLGVHVNTIRTMSKDGRLPAYKTKENTGHLRFLQSDLDDYQNEHDLSRLSLTLLKDVHHYYAKKKLDRMKVEALVGGGHSAELFSHLLHVIDPTKIFGSYLDLMEDDDYAMALQKKEHAWVAAAYLTIPDDDKTEKIKNRLSVGTGDFSIGQYRKISTTVLLFQGDDKQVVLDGTLQQFLPELPKGIIMMEREVAETFYQSFQEIEVSQFAKEINGVPENLRTLFIQEAT